MNSSEQPTANIKITSPAPQFGTQPLSFTLPLNTTIQELKGRITEALVTKPDASQQRLIYRGKILRDDSTISSVLGASANGEIINSEPSGCYTFHLALRPTSTSPSEQTPIGSFAGLPPSMGFVSHSSSLENSNPAHALEQQQRLLRLGASNNATAQTTVTTTQTSMHFPLGQHLPPGSASTISRTRSFRNSQGILAQGQSTMGRNNLLSLLSESDLQPLYLLQGPNGYRALLIPPSTHQFSPIAQAQRSESATNESEAGTNSENGPDDHRIPQLNINNFGMGAFYAQAPRRQNPNTNTGPVPAPVQQHPLAQRLYLDPADLVQRMRERANHIWLAVRLVVFVVLFSGGGGLRRTVTLGSLALLIFIWQTGILNEQWTNAQNLYRELFPRPPQPDALLRETLLAQQQSGIPLDPTVTAQLLIRRDNERRARRWRDMFESVERGVTIFLASLVPGLHERHVEAHQERQRQREQMTGALAVQQQQALVEQAANSPRANEPQQQPLAERDERQAGAANGVLIPAL